VHHEQTVKGLVGCGRALHGGETVGTGGQPLADIALNHLDGTKLIAAGRNGAIAVIAIAERG
jgi:fructose-1,6-bisphosphatase II